MSNSYEGSATFSQPIEPLMLPDWMGETIPTGARFSLVPAGAEGKIADIVAHTASDHRFGRFLIAKADMVDENLWSKLHVKNVPRLPLLRHENDQWIFGVKDGLKSLAHEALFGRQSSETYIGDQEIFYEVGRLYKRAYAATGSLLINKNDQTDNPLQHIAISSFSDGSGFLYLCPPYVEAGYYNQIDPSTAAEEFSASIARNLARQVLYQESLRDTAEDLVTKARQGFFEN